MKVSVIIAAYNVEAFIGRAIASVKAQTHRDWEIVVADDASGDGTLRLVQEMAREDDRIRLVRLERNGGPSAARNMALDSAVGDWVAVLDADDAWRPERLERMLAVAGATECDFVADNQVLFDDALGREVGTAYPSAGPCTPLTKEALFRGDFEGSPLNLGMLKPVIRREAIERRKLRYNPDLRYFEDYYFYAELLITGAVGIYISDPLYVYTMPVGTVSRSPSQTTRTTGYIPTRYPIVDDLCRKYRATLPAELQPLMKRYWWIARRRWVSNRITALRKTGRMAPLLAFMLAHPAGSAAYIQNSRTFKALARPFTG